MNFRFDVLFSIFSKDDMHTEVTIGVFTPTMLKPLLKIYNQSRCFARCFERKKATLQDFAQQIEGEKIYIAELKSKIVGFVSILEDSNFIHHLYVLPKYFGLGVGQALLKYCQDNHGLPLSLKCLKENRLACCFYENLGWVRKTTGVSNEGFYNLYRLG